MRDDHAQNLTWRPWAGALAERQIGHAALLFVMQISLVFWPVAVRIAQATQAARRRQDLLNELATVHAPTAPPPEFHPVERSFAEPSLDSSR